MKKSFPLSKVYGLLEPGPVVLVTTAVSVSPGVWLYQFTDEGVAVELTAKGTKYYKDDDLN